MNSLCMISAAIMVVAVEINGGEDIMGLTRPDSGKWGYSDNISNHRSMDHVLIESQYVRKPFRWPWAPGQGNASQSDQENRSGNRSGGAPSGSMGGSSSSSNSSSNMGGSSSSNGSTSGSGMNGSSGSGMGGGGTSGMAK